MDYTYYYCGAGMILKTEHRTLTMQDAPEQDQYDSFEECYALFDMISWIPGQIVKNRVREINDIARSNTRQG